MTVSSKNLGLSLCSCGQSYKNYDVKATMLYCAMLVPLDAIHCHRLSSVQCRSEDALNWPLVVNFFVLLRDQQSRFLKKILIAPNSPWKCLGMPDSLGFLALLKQAPVVGCCNPSHETLLFSSLWSTGQGWVKTDHENGRLPDQRASVHTSYFLATTPGNWKSRKMKSFFCDW